MTWLILGIVLWWAGHLFKRLAPGPRAAMTDRMGEASKGPVALVLLAGLGLIIYGFRTSDWVAVYDPPTWGRHLNNLMMVFAMALMGVGHSKSRTRAMIRHPMLTGALVWAAAHLLVNGDRDSLILFGSMGIWAIVEMMLINRAEPGWQRYEDGSLRGDILLAALTVVFLAIAVAVHIWLGFNPLPG